MMNFKLIIIILLTLSLEQISRGQSETYTIKKASFSSDKYDEFSPVYYKNGVVFCTNRTSDRVINYSTGQNKGLFKINYIDTTGKVKWQQSRLFSKSLTTILNDGPVTFTSKEDTIYYSRNLKVDGKLDGLSNVRNMMGIFYAVLVNGKWTKIRELRINDEYYNISTPWLSPDGKKLFFASDKPGGFGGSDLYYCQLTRNFWGDPVNLGAVINTRGNESYPFINPSGELFFSSDGHPGLGGKDIFFSRFADSVWLPPVRLDAPINSKYDDFGIITDTLMNEGYFSSNRDGSIDIFHFRTNFPQIFYTSLQRENQHCFKFSDNGMIVVDTTFLQYNWSFDDGKSINGAVVNHCFPGPGNYNVKLDIVERGTGKVFFTKMLYNLELRDFEQPYISSPDVAIKGDVVEFSGLKSYVPGFKILSYSWDFGDSIRSSGETVKHSFKEKGEYIVNMGVTLRSSTDHIRKTGVSKKISILNDQQEKASYLAKGASVKNPLPDIRKYDNAVINTQYSAETEFQKDAVFTVELLASKNKIGVNSDIFRNVPKKYIIKEKFNSESNTYSYIIDRQMSLMATYLAYKEMTGLGFKDVRIKVLVLSDPSEKELYNLIKIYGANADSYFDATGAMTSDAYIMLDQIIKLMKKNPLIILEVSVHSDNTGSPENSLALSQRRSQLLVNYLINRGISAKRLMAKGYGGIKPVAPNFLEKDRRLNRRIDFIILTGGN